MNELVTVEVQELKQIEQSKANAISESFSPMAARLAEFEAGYNGLICEAENGITEDTVKKAKRLRLDIGKIRIETGKIKDKQKADIKLLDKAIMGVHNFLVLAVKEKEDKLSEIEKHFERIKEEERKALQKEREELIAPYIEDVAGRDLAGMEDDVWEAYLTTSRQKYEDRIEAMRKAEEERIEANRRECLNRERLDILRPYFFLLADTEYEYLGSMEESTFSELLESAKQKKIDYDAEQKRIREENKRLQKEKEAAEKEAAEERAKVEAEKKAAEEKARKEREAIEAKAKKEREAAEKKLAAERAEKARIEKELQDKKDAEEAAAKAKAAAEKKAARAPDKDKIASFIEFLCIVQYPTVKSKEAQQIVAYAQNKVKELVSTLKQQNDRM